MDKKLRGEWEKEIPKIAHAINMTENSTTGRSPFEMESGSQPNSLADLMHIDPPEETDEDAWNNNPSVYEGIVGNIIAYHDIARKYGEARKAVENERLNRSHGPIRTYGIGDNVIFYVPRIGEKGWRAKHEIQWRFGTIAKVLGPTTYEVQEKGGSRKFQRSISCITPDREGGVAMTEEPRIDPGGDSDHGQDFELGDVVAVKEDYEQKTFEIGTVSEFVDEDLVRIRYWATTNPTLGRAFYRPVWVKKGGKVVFSNETGSTPWQGLINRSDVICKVDHTSMKKNGAKLTAASRMKLTGQGFIPFVLPTKESPDARK
jgi:hypothetical protein